MQNWKKKLLIYLCSLIPILVVAGMAFVDQYRNNYVLDIRMNGSADMLVEYGDAYEELGATAVGYGIIYDREKVYPTVTVEGYVDDAVMGTYQIVYTAEYAGITTSVTRTVCVEDTTPPVITLTENPEAYTVPGDHYVEEGFVAVDNIDGDLTALVVCQEEDGRICYQVSDRRGNVTIVYRQINYYDPTPPELYLKGDATIAMMMGKDYAEPGYWATDNCEGDITSKVQVSGTVDGYTPGTYTLQYTVTDNYGNVAAAVRTVIVADHPVQEYVENPERVIYLTFDDGPGPATPYLLDVLKKYNVKATFFVVDTAYINTIARAAEEGHTIAIHSASHVFRSIYSSEDAYFDDLYEMQGIIYDITGIETNILRFPGGSSNTVSRFNRGIMTRLAEQVEEEGFRYFDWNVDSCDAGGATTTEMVYQCVISGIGDKSTAVVLQHDIKSYSVEAVSRIIEWGLANGYTFLPLTEDSPPCEHGIKN